MYCVSIEYGNTSGRLSLEEREMLWEHEPTEHVFYTENMFSISFGKYHNEKNKNNLSNLIIINDVFKHPKGLFLIFIGMQTRDDCIF